MKLFLLTILLVPTLVIAEPRDLIGQIIDKLIQCESHGKQFAINKNEKHGASYGVLQFQEETWIESIKKYDLRPYAEDHELMNEIYAKRHPDLAETTPRQ